MSGLNELINKVHHSSAEDLLGRIPDDSIDLIVTSPPYDNLRTYNGFTWDFERIAKDSYRVLKPGGVLAWNTTASVKTLTGLRQALYFVDNAGFDMHQRIVWQKEGIPQKRPQAYYDDFEDVFILSKGLPTKFNPVLKKNKKAGRVERKGHHGKNGFSYSDDYRTISNDSLLTNVWLINVGKNNTASDDCAHEHPAPFPEKLAQRIIYTWSNTGDIVLDYFGGSGTTAKMARNHNRQWITGDISAEYCELMERRLSLPFTLNMFDTIESEAQ